MHIRRALQITCGGYAYLIPFKILLLAHRYAMFSIMGRVWFEEGNSCNIPDFGSLRICWCCIHHLTVAIALIAQRTWQIQMLVKVCGCKQHTFDATAMLTQCIMRVTTTSPRRERLNDAQTRGYAMQIQHAESHKIVA